ncbi:glutaredoxin [Desmospora sp. 8437]|nr:glutaredoxin [Desmospora sp. 8437]
MKILTVQKPQPIRPGCGFCDEGKLIGSLSFSQENNSFPSGWEAVTLKSR